MQPAKYRILGLALLLAASLPATACEPAVQMMVVFAGPSLLSIATLGFGILAKCGIFALLERSLSRKQAFAFLFIGNLYSTAIGVLLLLPFVVPLLMLGLLPLVFFLCLHPARRIIEFSGWEWTNHVRPWQIATGMTLLAVVSMVLFIIASEASGARNLVLYWPLKIGYIVCGMTIGIGLTALWEERVVAGLALRSRPACGYFTSVIRANYLAFGIALLVGAIRMLPRRLNSEDFLAWLLDVFGRG